MLKLSVPRKETTNNLTSAPLTSFLQRQHVITWESVIIIFLGVLAVISRFLALGTRVMSHDESLHVYYSWLLATGKGFIHNPMMHGPFLFESTAVMDFLFSANDFTSRLVPALLGIAI